MRVIDPMVLRMHGRMPVGQQELSQKINRNVEAYMLIGEASIAQSIVESNVYVGYDFRYIPIKPVKDIPIEWFQAAEITIIKKGSILNTNTVKLLAADAWFLSKKLK